TSSVAGYNTAPEAYGNVPDGGQGAVTLTAQVIPPTPTPEPTAEPTEAPKPTEAPDAESEALDDQVFQPFAAGDIGVDCIHAQGSPQTSFVVSVDDVPGNEPFSITSRRFDRRGAEVLPPLVFDSSPVSLPAEEMRRLEI